jgi:ribosomal protein L24
MPLRTFHIQVGDQVFLEEGGEEIGAVRKVAKDHVVIYIEGSGDFTLTGPEIAAVHDGKVRLDATKLEPLLLAAAQAAHDHETE